MDTTYTHTTWHVQPGREEAFVERWREWVEWSRLEGFEAQATLLRDLDNPRTFVRLGPWENLAAVRNWRALPGYELRVGRLAEVVESFEPQTLEVAAQV